MGRILEVQKNKVSQTLLEAATSNSTPKMATFYNPVQSALFRDSVDAYCEARRCGQKDLVVYSRVFSILRDAFNGVFGSS